MGRGGAGTRERPLGQSFRRLEQGDDGRAARRSSTPDSVVLDLAAGSGDPALSVAQRLIGVRVIALDSSRPVFCLPTHRPGSSASGQRSCASRVTRTLSHWRRILWTASPAAAALCSLAIPGWSCQKCCVCSSPAGAPPCWPGDRRNNPSSMRPSSAYFS